MAERYPIGLVDALTGRRPSGAEADLMRDGDGWALTGGEVVAVALVASSVMTAQAATAWVIGVPFPEYYPPQPVDGEEDGSLECAVSDAETYGLDSDGVEDGYHQVLRVDLTWDAPHEPEWAD